MHKEFCLEYLKGRDYLGDLGIDGRIALKWISRKWGLSIWTGLICIVLYYIDIRWMYSYPLYTEICTVPIVHPRFI
jgi:hypothetical protein